MADDSGFNKIDIDNSVMRINAARESFDMLDIQNRRFMYNPQTNTLILGFQFARGNKIMSSHAEEHAKCVASEPFDSFLRGWIGKGSSYKHGVIHFAPPINAEHEKLFVDAYNTLQMFRENGADADTVIRGFGKVWEQPLSAILPGCSSRARQKESREYNYLATAEMSTEQNYNMLDGRINNVAAVRADLTDGQTYSEIKELAPETLPDERPSVTEKLETAKQAVKPPSPEKSAMRGPEL